MKCWYLPDEGNTLERVIIVFRGKPNIDKSEILSVKEDNKKSEFVSRNSLQETEISKAEPSLPSRVNVSPENLCNQFQHSTQSRGMKTKRKPTGEGYVPVILLKF